MCAECERNGLVRLAVIRDHIVPLFEGGADDEANVQPLCQACSDRKTFQESLRGRGGGSKVWQK
jgi:5-methylcytosine-specific restriction protein A